jgi:hypothetical protein
MVTAKELRCTAPHPRIRGFTCRAKIATMIGAELVSHRPGRPPKDSLPIQCWRCGAWYRVVPEGRKDLTTPLAAP